MKSKGRMILFCICFSVVVTIGCGKRQDQAGNSSQEIVTSTEKGSKQIENGKTQKATGNVLVAYFTRNGNTDNGFPGGVDVISSASLQRNNERIVGNAELIAEWIAEETGGALHAITTKQQYPANYDDTVDLARDEQSEETYPELVSVVEDMDAYETVVIVYPNWWIDMPMPVYSFFENYDMSGKNIVAFCTHGGSGFSNTLDAIRELEPDATVTEGLAVYHDDVSDSKGDVVEKVKELGIKSESVFDTKDDSNKNTMKSTNQMTIEIENKTFTVALEDNDSVEELIRQMPMELDMSELNGNEKYNYLSLSLPEDAQEIGEIKAGDVMLYGDNCLVVFYESFFTTYSYTRIGHIENIENLKNTVGKDNVLIKFLIK